MPQILLDDVRAFITDKVPGSEPIVQTLPDWTLYFIFVSLLLGAVRTAFSGWIWVSRIFSPPDQPELVKVLQHDNEQKEQEVRWLRDLNRVERERNEELRRLLAEIFTRGAGLEAEAAKRVAIQGLIADKSSAAEQAKRVFMTGNVPEGMAILTRDAQSAGAEAQRQLTQVNGLEAAKREALLVARKWRRIGTLQLGIDDEAALQAFQSSLLFDDSSAGVQMEVARLLAKTSREGDAEKRYRAVIERFSVERPLAVANAWAALGALLARDRTRWEEAREAHRQAERMRRKSADYVGWAQSLGALGDLELTHGRMTEARKFHTRALKAPGRRLPELVARNHMRLGQIQYNLGQLTKAKVEFRKSIELLRKRKDSNLLRKIEGLAMAHIALGEFAAAKHKVDEGLRLAEDPEGKVRVLTAAGQLAVERALLEEATEHFSAAIEFAKKATRPYHRFQDDQLARVRALQGDPESAAKLHGAHAQQYQERGELDRWADCQLNLARACVLMKRPKPAREAMQSARGRFKKREHWLLLADCLAVEADILVLERNKRASKFRADAISRYREMGAAYRAQVVSRKFKAAGGQHTERR